MTAIGLFSALVPLLVAPVTYLFGARRALVVAAALCGVFTPAWQVWRQKQAA